MRMHCALRLLSSSDGVPVDGGRQRQECIVDKVENLAKQFGRRLTFTAIGIGDKEKFDMLEYMVILALSLSLDYLR